MTIEIRLLGRFELRRDGVAVEHWPRAAPKRLLKLLAVSPGRALPLPRAAELLWPHDHGERVRQRLHHLVYLLRGTAGADVVETADGVLRLQAAVRTDLDALDAALARALQPPPDAAAIEAALAAHAGALLPGDHDDAPIEARRRALERLRLHALATAARARQQAGDADGALRGWQQVVEAAPADEAAHRELIRLHGARGARVAAEQQYLACRRALADELGVAPGAATHQAYREAMRGAETAAPDGERFEPPRPPVEAIGRAALLDEIAAALRDPATRLLTLTGPGGMGKTLLAQHAAQRAATERRHGAVLVPLADADADADAATVADRLRRALRVADAPGADAWAALARALRDRELLLVCDNAEHVADALAPLAGLLAACPGLAVLATSRRRLNLAVEQVIELPPLPATADAALRLFAERARAAQRRFALDDANLGDVAAIVERLGGLPLAIELVAARAALYEPPALRRALDAGFDLVSGGGGDRPERHRSLAGSLAWSLALLAPAERTLLERLTLFAAPFGLDAAAALAVDLDGDATAMVQALVDLHLIARVSAADAARPRLQFAAATRALLRDTVPAPDDATARRFAGWFALRAEVLGADAATADLDADHENLLAAAALAERLGDAALLARFVTALARHWLRGGASARTDALVERAVERGAALPPRARCELLLAAAVYALECQRFARAEALALDALGAAREAGIAPYEARATLLYASTATHLGDPAGAIAPLRRVLDMAEAAGDLAMQRAALNNLGNCHLAAGDLARARRTWSACDDGFDGAHVQARVATVFNRSLAEHYAGRHDEAMRLSALAEELEACGPPRPARELLILVRRAWMLCACGQAEPAREALARARERAAAARLPVWEAVAAAHEGKLAFVQGRSERAAALLLRGLDACRGADPWDLLDLRLWLAWARLAAPEAEAGSLRTLGELVALGARAWRHERPRVLEAAAAGLAAAGRLAPAARALAQAEALRRQAGLRRFPLEQAPVRRLRAVLRGRFDAAPAQASHDLDWLARELADTADPGAGLGRVNPTGIGQDSPSGR